jgi:membrane protease YdiL (CAAX protease family)
LSGATTNRRDVAALVAVVALLAGFRVLRSTIIPDGAQTAVNLALIPCLAVAALAAGMTAAELGLAREHLVTGLWWGVQAFLVVAVALAVAASIPALRGLFDDDRVDVSAGSMLWQALVVIPVATVVMEELAFRGVLLGLLRRVVDDRSAVLVASVLFGLWHVPGTLVDGPGAVIGTVLATGVFGLVLCWLRLGSGSLVAPVLAHVATNTVAFVLAWVIAP